MELNYDFTLLMFVFMRITGCIMFNPILGRKNVPMIVKIGLTIILTLFSYGLVPTQTIANNSFFITLFMLMRELLFGFMIGYIIQLFSSVFLIAGESIDMQMGISMSKIYDPQSNISMPLSGSITNLMFVLIFFASNAHLTLIKIFIKLGVMIPFGSFKINPNIYQHLVSLFSLILIYAIKMSIPIIAAELITEIGVGLIMKAVPQIDVFVINIQLKVIIGLGVILIMIPPLGYFLENLIDLMFENISNLFSAFL